MARPEDFARYRFGVFELDCETGELKKRGVRLRLQEQPFRVLKMLLQSAGDVVPRDTMCALLWPASTYVDFDRSLNAAVAKLRQTLGDSAENPRFVETVARRGYRFVAPVESTVIPETAEHFVAPAVTQQVGIVQPPHSPKNFTHHLTWWIAGIFVSAIALLLVFARVGQNRFGVGPVLPMTKLTFDSGLTTDPVTSPDGKLFAYASDRNGDGHLHVWVQQLIPDGQAVQLTHGDMDDHQPTFSPDGNKVAFRSERNGGGIYVIPTLGGEAVLLAKDGHDPRFSPDGRWIAFWRGTRLGAPYLASAGTLHVVASDGGAPSQLRTDLIDVGVPAWSPDSQRLIVFGRKELFTIQLQSEWDWWIVSLRGGVAAATGSLDLLHKNGFETDFEAPRVASWRNDELLFSGRHGDSINVWSLRLDHSTSRAIGRPRQLTSGAGLYTYPSIGPEGRLLFANLTSSTNIWTLPIDASRGRASGPASRITNATSTQELPSLSADGRLLSYTSIRFGRRRLWIKDLVSGTEKAMTTFKGNTVLGELSADGSAFYYVAKDGLFTDSEGGSGFVTPLHGGAEEQFCSDCYKPWDLSHDNKKVIYRTRDNTIHIFNRQSRQDRVFVPNRKYEVYQYKFSPDGRWLAFEVIDRGISRLYITALQTDGVPAPENSWVAVSGPGIWADKPRWSPDGNWIYYISNQDGFFCVWAQRLAGIEKKPAGNPVAIHHFHSSRLSMSNVTTIAMVELALARDKIAVNLGELSGNIWTASVPRDNN